MNTTYVCTRNNNIRSHSIIKLANGYGLSILKIVNCLECSHYYEVAVIQFNSSEEYTLVYPSFTNGDIIRCNSYDQVIKLIPLIETIK